MHAHVNIINFVTSHYHMMRNDFNQSINRIFKNVHISIFDEFSCLV